jgi:hypothetical protein
LEVLVAKGRASLDATVVDDHVRAIKPSEHAPGRSKIRRREMLCLGGEDVGVKHVLRSDDAVFVYDEGVPLTDMFEKEVGIFVREGVAVSGATGIISL